MTCMYGSIQCCEDLHGKQGLKLKYCILQIKFHNTLANGHYNLHTYNQISAKLSSFKGPKHFSSPIHKCENRLVNRDDEVTWCDMMMMNCGAGVWLS